MSAFRDPADALAINRAGWDRVAARFYGGTALPSYGPLAPTEDSLRLLDPVSGARVLEVGCGSGHSLRYLAEQGAAELWGLDLSPAQLAFAADVLRPYQPRVHLFESPMEVDPGIPAGAFDLVISIYALGWTTDLPATLALIAGYLRPGGCFIFSWEHPVYGCLRQGDGEIVFAHPYAAEGQEEYASWNGVRIVQHRRTMSTFINEVVRAGLQVEALVEGELDTTLSTDDHADSTRWYTIPRARMMPTTFILKARKPLQGATTPIMKTD
ncbi:MAG TPA: class I SAM-dependent methyltransferase [Longimicrobium sp.]|nr:class I SAM-dependent methyltransferase [Longimicrobium sp.]